MNDQIFNILNQVRLLKSKYDELAAVTGEQFNVFSILGVEADEVRTHSAFLADLLSPQGSHRQGDAFQKLFLKVALNRSGPDEYGDSEPFQVRKEASTDQGQIDILLENKEACIVIENKIYAGDQNRQMERYYQYATSKRSSEKQIKLVYLTLDGSPPSTESLGNLPEDSVKCLSYSEDIINWLEECMKLQEVQRIAPIREIVFQYRDLLKELTGQSTNTRYSMELTELLIKDKNYELIPHLEQALLELKVQTQLKFWQELANIMPQKVDQSGIHDDQEKEASEGNIRHFYTGSRDRLWYGTTFKLDSFSWKQTEIALRVELGVGGGDRVFYGFILFEDGKRVKSCDNKKFDSHAEKLPDYDFTRNNWWLGWKRPKKDLGFPVEYLGSEAGTLLFLLDDKRRKAVGQLVTEIATTVTQLKKNLNQS